MTRLVLCGTLIGSQSAHLKKECDQYLKSQFEFLHESLLSPPYTIAFIFPLNVCST